MRCHKHANFPTLSSWPAAFIKSDLDPISRFCANIVESRLDVARPDGVLDFSRNNGKISELRCSPPLLNLLNLDDGCLPRGK